MKGDKTKMFENQNYYSVHNAEENKNHAFNLLIRGSGIDSEGMRYLEMLKGIDAGMYNFPDAFQDEFKEALKYENVFRRLGNEKMVCESGGMIVHTESDGTASVVNAGDEIPESDDTIQTSYFDSHKIASRTKMEKVFISDMYFDIDDYLKNEFARRFGRAEEDVFINGTGENEPKGILASAEIGKTVIGTSFLADDLVSLYFSLDRNLRKNAVWLMNDEIAMKVRKMKDEAGNFIWKENDTIFGKPVEISNFMADETKPIAFGDFSYYWVIDRMPLSVCVQNEKYALQGKVGYIAYERLDGKLIKSDAIKLLALEEE